MAMTPKNTSGVQGLYGDLGLAGQNQEMLTEAQKLQQKKKLLAAGQADNNGSLTSMLFPRNNMTGSMGV